MHVSGVSGVSNLARGTAVLIAQGIEQNDTNGKTTLGPPIRPFEILLNADRLDGNPQLKNSVAAHELGHTLGLYHPQDSSGAATIGSDHINIMQKSKTGKQDFVTTDGQRETAQERAELKTNIRENIPPPHMGPAMQRRRALPGTKINALCTPKSQTLWV